MPTYPIVASGGIVGLVGGGQSVIYNESTANIKYGRYEDVTRGKRKGVKYIIKVL